MISNHLKKIKSEIGDISEPYTHFFTEGRWSSYELLLYLLFISGKADITITSFSISEQFLRALKKAKENGYINLITGVFNVAVRRYKTDLMFFAANLFDEIYVGNFHLKIFLIKNDKFSITVNQSANATPNPAHEAGVICTDIDIYNLYLEKINTAISKAQLFDKHDIFRRHSKKN